MLTRRRFAKASVASFIASSALARSAFAATNPLAPLPEYFAKIEADSGGRLGVFVLDTQSGASAGHRADERFRMCSTVKLLVAAATLARVDSSKEQLERRVAVAPSDILSYAPIAKQHVGGDMSVAELSEAAITLSDNTAANLLVAALGGPAAVTQFARLLGDEFTRLDRIEPELNFGDPEDPRDTTTPATMAKDLAKLATGAALSPASRDQLIAWLIACKTGDSKLRAGLPKAWRVGDKTGSDGRSTSNDVAVIWPEGRPPVVVAAYLTASAASEDKKNATHAAIGRAVAGVLTA